MTTLDYLEEDDLVDVEDADEHDLYAVPSLL
jgi:hypothetical protein